jgi:hypothetical protein
MNVPDQNADRPSASSALRFLKPIVLLLSVITPSGHARLHAQCPSTGETKVIKPNQGTGYSFYVFKGDGSFRYFLDGQTISLTSKDDPEKTFVFIDDMAYEPLFIERAQLQTYTKSTNLTDILRAQAKYEQGYFKNADPSMLITDYGPASRKSSGGSEDRVFYLWKKESAPGKTAATQYLVSTPVKDGIFVMSFMPRSGSISEEAMFPVIQSYTSRFDTLSSNQCGQVLAMPSAP